MSDYNELDRNLEGIRQERVDYVLSHYWHNPDKIRETQYAHLLDALTIAEREYAERQGVDPDRFRT